TIAIHIAAILFGLTGIFGELVQASPAAITAGRAVFAVLALTVAIRLQGPVFIPAINARNIGPLAAAGAMLAVHWITFFMAVKISGVAIATLGFASFPAFITVCEYALFKEKISRKEWT